MVLTNFDEIATRVAELRNYGATIPAWERHKTSLYNLPAYTHAGYNYKMTDIQASIGLEQVKKLPSIIELRRVIAHRYNQMLDNLPMLSLPTESPNQTHVYQSYVCLINYGDNQHLNAISSLRKKLWLHLSNNGIASVQGAQAMPTIQYYQQKYRWNPADFPMTMRADACSIALPIYPSMSLDQQDRVIQAVRSFQL